MRVCKSSCHVLAPRGRVDPARCSLEYRTTIKDFCLHTLKRSHLITAVSLQPSNHSSCGGLHTLRTPPMSAVIIIRGFISNEQIGCTCNASLYSGWRDGTDKGRGASSTAATGRRIASQRRLRRASSTIPILVAAEGCRANSHNSARSRPHTSPLYSCSLAARYYWSETPGEDGGEGSSS